MNTLEIFQTQDKAFGFRIKLDSGAVLLNGAHFPTQEAIQATVADIRANMKEKNFFERKTDYQGKFQFALKNNTGKVIGYSATYDSEAGMENGIKNLTRHLTHTS
ncbi:YegP family protein [Flagellimonas sp. DF-77]|uniref:YegP family protein n=1 Tax=Flagellimonas algarum TaxID=3230298 RepID=UPI00339224DA